MCACSCFTLVHSSPMSYCMRGAYSILVVSLATQPSPAGLMTLFILRVSWHYVRFESSEEEWAHSRNYSYVPESLRLNQSRSTFPTTPLAIESYSSCSTPGQSRSTIFPTTGSQRSPRRNGLVSLAVFLGPRDTRHAPPQQLYHLPRDNTKRKGQTASQLPFPSKALSPSTLCVARTQRQTQRGGKQREKEKETTSSRPPFTNSTRPRET